MRFTIESLDVVNRHILKNPVRTSFGVMRSRPAVFLRIRDTDGTVGYGEIWCNFPQCGAEHRALLAETELAPRIEGRQFENPREAYEYLQKSTHVLMLQTGETGPIWQAIAGVDLAIWDLVSRRAGQPLYQMLGGGNPVVPVYASGINPTDVTETAERLLNEGYTRFKLKVGFGADTDLYNARTIRAVIGRDRLLMLDANQGWDLGTALGNLEQLATTTPYWIEEPLPVDSPQRDWQRLKSETGLKIAGGENFKSGAEFGAAAAGGWLDFIQPDICKWGGITGCLSVSRDIVTKGKVMCPHTLGGGVALAGSAHLLAATGGGGFLEVDSNPNPLRQDLFQPALVEGAFTLDDTPGLGVRTEILDSYFA